MWIRFIRAMEHRAYIVAEREKRAMGSEYETVIENWKLRLFKQPTPHEPLGVDIEKLKKGVL
jgi:hypothetical protein